ncbi:MAG: hypothetical protein LBP59_07065 [Planctomycetaceae bacterium]|jgi:hypothetical protein|nr:hypothetical protein [Planctomycetaceae bacterium]
MPNVIRNALKLFALEFAFTFARLVIMRQALALYIDEFQVRAIYIGTSLKIHFLQKGRRRFAAVFIFWAAMEFMIPINFSNS